MIEMESGKKKKKNFYGLFPCHMLNHNVLMGILEKICFMMYGHE